MSPYNTRSSPYQASKQKNSSEVSPARAVLLLIFLVCMVFFAGKVYLDNRMSERVYDSKHTTSTTQELATTTQVRLLDKALYDTKVLLLANLPPIAVASSASSSTSTPVFIAATSSDGWPVKTAYPKAGALLPFNRIIAYYGNFYSKKMGILGEYDGDIVLQKLRDEVKVWNDADPSTPVVPAIHYIVAVAQADKGKDGDYLARMPDGEILKALTMAKEVEGIVFLDIQFGHSTVASEVSAIKEYLQLPQVHLGLDPEFYMKNKKQPGTSIGTMDAIEINQAIEMLSQIVQENNLPPKILMIHRFTEAMVTNYQNIRLTPEVQVIMNMDGWGSPELKTATYKHVAFPEPVQFTGVKIFYKNDVRPPSTRLMTPQEVLQFRPKPIYIQYQ